jgi:hypothetical protein
MTLYSKTKNKYADMKRRTLQQSRGHTVQNINPTSPSIENINLCYEFTAPLLMRHL